MASYLVSSLLLLIWLCLHAHVYGRELQGLKRERSSLHNDSIATPLPKEVAPVTKNFLEKDAQSNLLSKNGGYSIGQPVVGRYLNKELSMDRPLASDRDQFIFHYAVYKSPKGQYYGTIATINIWSLQDITSPKESASGIWVTNIGDHSPESINTIQAGWHVHPRLYNDNNTHFYTHWTADGYQKTGCYNLDCPGFVLTNHSLLVPGYIVEPTSTYHGEQYTITLKIYKDPQTGDWLLFEGPGDAPNFVGYWPKSLFTNLADSASQIEWGGGISFTQPDTSPPMGSGHFPNHRKGESAYFKHIQYVNDKGDLEFPNGSEVANEDKQDCYKVGPFLNEGEHDDQDGWSFFFGGPGGCKD